MIIVRDGKAEFGISCRDHCNGILQWERELRFNSEYSMGKWEFTAKEQSESQWVENY